MSRVFHGLAGNFGLCPCVLHVTRYSTLEQLAQKFGACTYKQRTAIVRSAEFVGKLSLAMKLSPDLRTLGETLKRRTATINKGMRAAYLCAWFHVFLLDNSALSEPKCASEEKRKTTFIQSYIFYKHCETKELSAFFVWDWWLHVADAFVQRLSAHLYGVCQPVSVHML